MKPGISSNPGSLQGFHETPKLVQDISLMPEISRVFMKSLKNHSKSKGIGLSYCK